MIRALKACRFSGKDYSAGEIVPETAIDKKALGALKMMKLIEVAQEPPTTKAGTKRKKIEKQPDL